MNRDDHRCFECRRETGFRIKLRFDVTLRIIFAQVVKIIINSGIYGE